ncbi:MAG: DUF3696 domain-containing protein [Nitrosopumilaceae archaeon]
MILTKVNLQNFKIHQNTSIEPKKINIFIGPNGAGKSSILQALLILKKSLTQQAPMEFVTRDDSFDLGKYEDIARNGDVSKSLVIGIGGKQTIPLKIERRKSADAEFRYSLTIKEGRRDAVFFKFKLLNLEAEFDSKRNNLTCTIKDTKEKKEFQPLSIQLDRNNPRFSLQTNENPEYENFNRLFQNGEFTETLLKNYHYIPYLRTAATYGVRLSPLQDELISKHLEETISKTFSKLSKKPRLLDEVSDLMYNLWGKRVRPRNVDIFEENAREGITLDFLKNKFSNSIVHEGTGINQTVLLLTILTGSDRGSIIGIEEPEIHMHPKAQSKLAKIIMDISKLHSKQIMFTTHSEHMLYPFLASVASRRRGSIKAEDLAIYYFEEDDYGGTNVNRLRVNEHGQVNGGLKGFWDTDLDALSEFLGKK